MDKLNCAPNQNLYPVRARVGDVPKPIRSTIIHLNEGIINRLGALILTTLATPHSIHTDRKCSAGTLGWPELVVVVARQVASPDIGDDVA